MKCGLIRVNRLAEEKYAIVAEDEMIIAHNLKILLQSIGFSKVITVGSVAELREYQNVSFDLAFLDLKLSDGSSEKFVFHFSSRGIPTIVHSGHLNEQNVSLGQNVHFLAKPSTRARIKALVKSVIELD